MGHLVTVIDKDNDCFDGASLILVNRHDLYAAIRTLSIIFQAAYDNQPVKVYRTAELLEDQLKAMDMGDRVLPTVLEHGSKDD